MERHVQTCPEPRLASAEHLLTLCEEHIAEEHERTMAAAERSGQALKRRLLAELSKHLKRCSFRLPS